MIQAVCAYAVTLMSLNTSHCTKECEFY